MLFGLTSNNQFLKAIPKSQSVHRMIVHGVSFINYFKYPIGSLSESAIEARNNPNKSAQVGHVRLTSFAENTRDTANYLFMTSYMYLYCKKNKIH